MRDRVDLIGNNLEDILAWCRARRPDVVASVKELAKRDDIMLLLAIAYQAGRASAVAEAEVVPLEELLKEWS